MAVSYTSLAIDARLVDESISGASGVTTYPISLVIKDTDGVLTVVCRTATTSAASQLVTVLNTTP